MLPFLDKIASACNFSIRRDHKLTFYNPSNTRDYIVLFPLGNMYSIAYDIYSESVRAIFREYFKTAEQKFFVFCGDGYFVDEIIDRPVFQVSCYKDSKYTCLPYEFKIDESVYKPIEEAGLDVFFQGMKTTHCLRENLKSALPSHIKFVMGWDYYCDAGKKMYFQTLNDSKFVLCPRGLGLNSIRFFETLAYGRIPVLIADDTKLPNESSIDYASLIVRVPEHDASKTDDYITAFLENNDISVVSARCREVYKNHLSSWKRFFEHQS